MPFLLRVRPILLDGVDVEPALFSLCARVRLPLRLPSGARELLPPPPKGVRFLEDEDGNDEDREDKRESDDDDDNEEEGNRPWWRPPRDDEDGVDDDGFSLSRERSDNSCESGRI